MARPNFYNDNENRSFPFLRGTVGVKVPDTGLPTKLAELPDDFIVDCGFTTGPDSEFDVLTHSIYLSRIYRTGSLVYFEFSSDAPELYGKQLTFTRSITDSRYQFEYLDGEVYFNESESISLPDSCSEPLWSGYLVTGDMADIAARVGDGQAINRQAGEAIVEPALIQNLSNTIVNSIELANDDRTRATSPTGCPDITWPHQTGVIFVQARCVQGNIRWKPGYNATITQNDFDNSITIGAAVGAGEGEPCGEVPLFDAEAPPIGSANSLLSGGALCNETLRSLNGVGGPSFTFIGGQGVSIVPDPDNHCIRIDVNLVDMALCISDFSEVSQ